MAYDPKGDDMSDWPQEGEEQESGMEGVTEDAPAEEDSSGWGENEPSPHQGEQGQENEL
jgi:hypothetical protein